MKDSAAKLRPVRRGDTIGLVTPASPVDAERLDFVTQLLAAEGYQTRIMPHALERDGFLAGSDQNRAHDFAAAFADDSIAAVLCTRGGYGCARMLPYLDLDAIAASRKLLLGFSDVTTLHLALNRRGMPTVHAPMALTLSYPREEWVYESFRRVLRNELTIPEAAPAGTCIVPGRVEARMTGGCLCLICDSIGTPNAIDAEGKLLLIEDVDEHPHRVDAMLTHLLSAGIADQAAGFVIGEMTRTDERVDEAIGSRAWRDIVIERLSPLGKPMVIDYPLGHAKNMLTLPFGIAVELDASAGRLEYRESLCA